MLAKECGCESVAFPLISSGIFGYPKDQALKVAIDTISSFLLENEMTVYIVIFDRKAYQISGKLFADIASYIDDRYVDEHTDSRSERLRRMSAFRMEEPMPCESSVCDEAIESSQLLWQLAPRRRQLLTMHWNRSMRAFRRCCCGRLMNAA